MEGGVKIAIFKRAESGWESYADERYEKSKNYIRITEYVEVDFIPLRAEQTIPKEVAYLREKQDQESVRHVTAMAKLDERISKLLAITHER